MEAGDETQNDPAEYAHVEALGAQLGGRNVRYGRGKRKPVVLVVISSKSSGRLWSKQRFFAIWI
jgi:hypothetical protein